jgi:hypothetical protein
MKTIRRINFLINLALLIAMYPVTTRAQDAVPHNVVEHSRILASMAQQPIYDTPCPAGTSPLLPYQTTNPANGHIKVWACVDPTGTVFLQSAGGGTVTITGSPIANNMTGFSGPNSITNAGAWNYNQDGASDLDCLFQTDNTCEITMFDGITPDGVQINKTGYGVFDSAGNNAQFTILGGVYQLGGTKIQYAPSTNTLSNGNTVNWYRVNTATGLTTFHAYDGVSGGAYNFTTGALNSLLYRMNSTNACSTNNGLLVSNSSSEIVCNGTAVLGTDNSVNGTLTISNGSATAHTIFGSAATTTNTVLGPATVIPDGHAVACATSGTTCTMKDGGALGGTTAILRRSATSIADGTTTTLNSIGDVIAATGSPTIAAVAINTQNSAGVSYTPTGTGTTFGISGNLNYNTVKNVFWTFLGVPGRSTNEVLWFGMSDQSATTMGNSSNPAGNYASFRYSTPAGDTHYQCITKDATTQTIVDSGITPVGYLDSTGGGVNFSINLIGNGTANTSAVFYINGAIVCTITTHLPASGAADAQRTIIAGNNSASTTNATILVNEITVAQDSY